MHDTQQYWLIRYWRTPCCARGQPVAGAYVIPPATAPASPHLNFAQSTQLLITHRSGRIRDCHYLAPTVIKTTHSQAAGAIFDFSSDHKHSIPTNHLKMSLFVAIIIL